MIIERYRSCHHGARPVRFRSTSDSGIGLIEIVISMFLISLLAIAFVPVMVSAMRASTLNSTAATATRLVAQAVDDARTRSAADCAAAQLLNAQRDTVDAQGVTLRVVTSVPTVANCVNGSVITVTVTAVSVATSELLADARTQIYLDGTP